MVIIIYASKNIFKNIFSLSYTEKFTRPRSENNILIRKRVYRPRIVLEFKLWFVSFIAVSKTDQFDLKFT